MVKYIGKVMGFLAILGGMILGVFMLCTVCSPLDQFVAFLTCSDGYHREDVAQEILKTAQEGKNEYQNILVGDSVCYMLFANAGEVSDEYFLAGNTRPCTMATQYVLVNEFLESHPEAKDVYLFYSKESWESVMDVKCGYSYVVVPHMQAGTFDKLGQETVSRAEEMFGPFLVNKFMANAFDRSFVVRKIVLNSLTAYHEKVLGEDLSAPFERTENEISPLALSYFRKMVETCDAHQTTLHLIHDPLADTEEKHAEVEMERRMFQEAGLYEEWQEYFDSVLYYPEEYFFDGVHFLGEENLSDAVIQDISEHTELMTDIFEKR